MADDAPAYLVTGSEEVLVRRAVEAILERLRGGGELEVTDLRADELGEVGLPDLRTGSLFGTPQAVRIRGAHALGSDHVAGLLAALEGGAPASTLILEASGTGRIRKLAKRIDELGGRVDVAPPREFEERKWLALVADEFARHGREADASAQQALLDHAGLDVGAIAEKASQVVAGAPPGRITAERVEAVVIGHGDRGAFAVADAMCDRDPAKAVKLLRGALDGGQDPVMVLGALAYRLRTIVAVAGGVASREEIGTSVSAGQARRLGAIRRNFGPGELTRAYRVLADADVAIKTSAVPPDQAVERAVIDIATPA